MRQERILCSCYGVPEDVVREAVRERGLSRISEVTRWTRAGGGCYTCWPEIREILGKQETAPGTALGERVAGLLEGDLKEIFALNGIQARIAETDGGRIYVEFRGEGPRGASASLAALRDHLGAHVAALCGPDVEICDLYIDGLGEGVSTL